MSTKNARSAWLCVVLLVLSACASPAAAPTSAPTADLAATQAALEAGNKNAVATSVAATLTAQPSNTPLPTNTAQPTNTTQPTQTPKPTDTPTSAPSATSTTAATVAPTATKKPTAKPAVTKPAVTQPAATQPPAATKPAATGGSVYSEAAGGPQGYRSILGCSQASGAACQSAMPAGDIAFSIRLEAASDAVLAIFLPFGLAVEKDGANAADMYMTVDAGWLEPGHYALMGTSRSFNQSGHYVIRTNGCLMTKETYPNCTWWTVNGTVVTFDIQ